MIRVETITKKYKKTIAVNRVSLSFKAPDIFGVLGPSGSGKSTLLRLIAGLDTPDEGSVIINNEKMSTPKRIKPPSSRKISLVFQGLALWPHMTARENIEFAITGNGQAKKQRKEKVDGVLERMHLEAHENRYPQQLSGGERQRLAIARAIISEPRYLLMDEPFTALDPLLREDLIGIILKLKKDLGMVIIHVSQNIELALNLSDKIAVMNKGILEQAGDKEEIISKPQSGFLEKALNLSRQGKYNL